MNKLVSLAVAGAMAATSIAAVTPADAAPWKKPGNGYSNPGHPNNGPGNWGQGPGGWNNGPGPGPAWNPHPAPAPQAKKPNVAGLAAVAILGFAVGALIANNAKHPATTVSYDPPPRPYGSWQQHVGWCHANYRSYQEVSDTFTGYDGVVYRCIEH